MGRVLFTILAMVFSGQARAACADAVSSQSLVDYTDDMVDSYTELDLGAVPVHAATARAALPCVTQTLSPAAVSAFFRGQGLALYLANQAERAAPWFAGAVAAAPGDRLPEAIAPDQSDGNPHPLRAAYEAAAAAYTATEAAPELSVGWIQIDGAREAAVPTDRPFVLQQFNGRGELLKTALVLPGEALQLDEALTQAQAGDTSTAGPAPVRSGRAPVFLSSTGIVVGGGVALATWLTRTSTCTLPDSNGDGYADCSAGASTAFYGGLALGAVSGSLLALQLRPGQDTAPMLQLSASQNTLHANFHASF